MKKYVSNAYLLDKGALVKPGEELELRDDQALRLGDKVTPIEVEEVEEVKVEVTVNEPVKEKPAKEEAAIVEKPKKETNLKKESK